MNVLLFFMLEKNIDELVCSSGLILFDFLMEYWIIY